MKKGRPLVDEAVYIYIYYIIQVYSTCTSRHLRRERDRGWERVREGERDREMMSFTHIRGCSSVTLGRVWVSAHGLYILYISIDAHMRCEFTTFKMYVSDIGHYIRGRRRRRRTSVPSRILLKTFFLLFSPRSDRTTYPRPPPTTNPLPFWPDRASLHPHREQSCTIRACGTHNICISYNNI